ncbi:MAG: GH3 auxin-responsive promoter family protein [Rhodospirillales bacterium]|nr:GH3 auxin-responsive promoter family protein [Rhodospirillales bacterium]
MIDLTPAFRLYAASRLRRLARMDPVMAQQRQLSRLLARAKTTRFGRDHDFASLRDVADFQRAVPLRRYEDLWNTYWRPSFPRVADVTWPGTIPYFAVTSGTTTGVTKYIPCTRDMIRGNRRAGLDVICFHLAARPHSRLCGGSNFMLGGSTAFSELAPGIWAGDLSGIAGKTVPWWFRPVYFPPRHLETIADWEEKIARLAPAALARDIRSIGGTPSWLLLFFDRLAELLPHRSRRLVDAFPRLELLVHGGVSFAPYRSAFAQRLAGSAAETREVYPASEGFIAAADRGDGEGLRLMADNGLFFEFVPVEDLDSDRPTRHWLATAQTGVNYAIVLTTCAGLWSYIIGDTVRFISLNPPRLLVTGRTSYSLSAFGEHLIGEEIETAVAAAAAAIGRPVTDYAVGAVYPDGENSRGGHLFIIEFGGGDRPAAAQVAEFAAHLDTGLAAENDDYRVHRCGDFGMAPPQVHAVAAGTFAAWMKSRGRLGGQNKVPRVITDGDLFATLKAFTKAGS